VSTTVDGLEADLGDSGPRAASGGHRAGVPSGGRRAASGECADGGGRVRRAADLEPGAADLESLRSSASAARRVWDSVGGGRGRI